MRRVTPEYFAGWFDVNGSIYCVHKNDRNPQMKIHLNEMGDGRVLRQISHQLDLPDAVPVPGRVGGWRLQIHNREQLLVFVRWVRPYSILKREILDKSEEILNQLGYLARLRELRPAPPVWDDKLEKDYVAALLELYELVAEHDEIRTRKDD